MTYASGKIIQLTAKLNPADTSLTADRDIGITNGRFYFKNDLQEEWISFTGVSASGSYFSYTGLTRGLSQVANPATAGTGNTWLAGSIGTLVAMHDQLADTKADNTFNGTNTFQQINATDLRFTGTTTSGLRIKSLTTTQRDALTPATGDKIINSTTGTEQTYYGGTWNDNASGTVANASETVAGKVELGTDAEFTAGTAIGGTGASLVATLVQLLKSIFLKPTETAIAEIDYMVFGDVSDSNKDKKILKSDVRNDFASNETLKGMVEKATLTETQDGTADKFPDAEDIKTVYGFISRVKITSDLTSTTSTLADATGLSFSLSANTYYSYEFYLPWSSDSGTYGINISMKYTGTTTFNMWTRDISGSDTGGSMINSFWREDDSGVASSGPNYATGTYLCIVRGTILTTSSGTLKVRFANSFSAGITPVQIKGGANGILINQGT